MYRNVMVPVDGSSFSREAVVQGLRVASNSGATLRLVRVGTPSVYVAVGNGSEARTARLKGLESAELGELYEIAAECRANSTVNVTASLQRGPIADALIGYAKRQGVDLIVMRSHARKGLARVWFGSVADDLIRHSGIPVLVTRPPSLCSAMETGFRFRRILVPLDGSALAEQALASAAALARIDGASIVLLSVITPDDQPEPGELESTIGDAGANHVAEVQRYLQAVRQSEALRDISVSSRVMIADEVAGMILELAALSESDLIAIATRGRGAITRAAAGSVSDRVMREATVSVLVVHPESQVAEVELTKQAGLVADAV